LDGIQHPFQPISLGFKAGGFLPLPARMALLDSGMQTTITRSAIFAPACCVILLVERGWNTGFLVMCLLARENNFGSLYFSLSQIIFFAQQ